MPPKQATKGQKQIAEENKSTLNFYQYVTIGVNVIYFSLQILIYWRSFTTTQMLLAALAMSICFGCYQFMANMAKPTYGSSGNLLDGGIDLNMDSGMAEHAKDMILLTCIVQTLSLVSSYFWLLWLLAPTWAFYLLWTNFLGPWFFAPAPEEDEKKTRKMERKMKRN
ncbi:transmembrane protein 208-like [Liolophura sinensis]|uniref:transmembrane protein 208-like n=1 Tax=Liolophura sinensis TaxID=3198878 RepID=UPI00315853F8